jgi:hypothetical protein
MRTYLGEYQERKKIYLNLKCNGREKKEKTFFVETKKSLKEIRIIFCHHKNKEKIICGSVERR